MRKRVSKGGSEKSRGGPSSGPPATADAVMAANLSDALKLTTINTSVARSSASSSDSENFTQETKDIWNEDAKLYDQEAWHHYFAHDVMHMSPPKSGDKVLDLGCGTGIYTVLASKAVGPSGVVVGVDFSTGMLDRLKQKKAADRQAYRNIMVVDHDITDMVSSKTVQLIVERRGGFDLITCFATMHLLASVNKQAAAVRAWASLLRPGGRMILEGPSADDTVNNLLRDLANEMWTDKTVFQRPHGLLGLQKMLRDAGLVVTKTQQTATYDGDFDFGKEQMDFVLNSPEYLVGAFSGADLMEEYGKARVQRAWKRIWTEAMVKNGCVNDSFKRAIVIGVKPPGAAKTGQTPGTAELTKGGPSLKPGQSPRGARDSPRDSPRSRMQESTRDGARSSPRAGPSSRALDSSRGPI